MKVRGKFTVEQLCTRPVASKLAQLGPMVAETKADGLRLVNSISAEYQFWANTAEKATRARPRNIERALHHLTNVLPDLKRGTLLDGEGALLNPRTLDRRGKAMSAIARAETTPDFGYVLFDLPWCCGVDIRNWPQRNRRSLLDYIWSVAANSPTAQTGTEAANFKSAVQLSQQFEITPTVFEDILELGYEGLVLKAVNSPYVCGDSSKWWAKLKEQGTADVVIMGYTAGEGKYVGLPGAVRVGQYFPDGRGGMVLRQVCQISGMTDDIRRSLGPGHVGLVIAMKFQSQTSQSFNHPSWGTRDFPGGFRSDKSPEECIWHLGES
ncbi:MAG: ATP-dependent DNA ligase [Xanthomonadales bacterium]|nr:ATP-dependent DNA ligase [Xanthomonadales bacterium]